MLGYGYLRWDRFHEIMKSDVYYNLGSATQYLAFLLFLRGESLQ